MKKDLPNKIFIVVLILFFSVILFKFIKNSNYYNLVDNRTSYKFVNPTISTILSGEYQTSVEDAAADQMPKYNYFKLAYIKLSNYINIKTLCFFKLDKLNRYIKLSNINLYKNYLLYNPVSKESLEKSAQNDIDEINNLKENTKANIYLYYIENDENYDFSSDYRIDMENYLKDNLNIDNSSIGIFNLESFENYKKCFYVTDHHWNYEGANKGYVEIASLMNLKKVLEPVETICFDKAKSDGSKAKNVGAIDMFKDIMCKYRYNYPEFEIFVSGEQVSDYGKTTEDLLEKSIISYGDIYGWDYDEIIFINKEIDNNRKLLIYSNSYSNAINKLLASHYEETYVIDGRKYQEKTMVEYINENKIDDVLILGNNMLFRDNISW